MSKYSVMDELARAFKGSRPTGAGAKRDQKLKAAEDTAMGTGSTARQQAREQTMDDNMRKAAARHKARKMNVRACDVDARKVKGCQCMCV